MQQGECDEKFFSTILKSVLLDGKTIAAVTWGSNRFDVFAVDRKGNLIHVYWDDSQYKNEDLGSVDEMRFNGAVSATTWGPGRLAVVAFAYDATISKPGKRVELPRGRLVGRTT